VATMRAFSRQGRAFEMQSISNVLRNQQVSDKKAK